MCMLGVTGILTQVGVLWAVLWCMAMGGLSTRITLQILSEVSS